MSKDLTNSRIDRQNILNNEIAIEIIREKFGFNGILWEGKMYFTREMAANFFEVDMRTISRYLEQYSEELLENGYIILRGSKLKSFISTVNKFGKDINVSTKTTILGVFDFRAFLNIAMLLSESDKARSLRQLMLDIVIDIINRKTGGGTKYINQRDKDFVFSSLQEDNYRKQFTNALKEYVVDDRYKYAYFTDMIYVSIFKEKAKEYKKIGVVYVTTPTELTQGQRSNVEERLRATSGYDSLEMNYIVEPKLLGGIRIRIGDRVVDNSIQTKLEEMTRSLAKVRVWLQGKNVFGKHEFKT